MSIYFTASQIPELRDLPKAARRVIVGHALGILRSRARLFYWLPTLLCAVGALGGVYLCGTLLPHSYHLPAKLDPSVFECYLGLGAGFATGFIGLQLQLWKLRPLLHSVIDDYISEIHTARLK